MQKYNVHVTQDSYDKKPDRETIMKIQRTIGVSKRELTKELLAHMLVNGHAVTTGILKAGIYRNGGQNVTHNEVLMIDFDNEEDEIYSIDDVKNHSWVQENVAFLYETYSTTKERPRFRAVVFLKEPIPAEDVKQTYKYIFDRLEDFPMDTQAQNPDRLFFGSKSGEYIEVDMDNEWEAKQKPKPERKARAIVGTGVIPYDEGLDIITAYVNLRGDDLHDNNQWIDAMYNLHGAYVNEEITEQQALDYAESLADGNSEWADDNINRMRDMLGDDDVKKVFPFRDKFQSYVVNNDYDQDYPSIRASYLSAVAYEKGEAYAHAISNRLKKKFNIETNVDKFNTKNNNDTSVVKEPQDDQYIDHDGREIVATQHESGMVVHRYKDTDEIADVEYNVHMYGRQQPFDDIADVMAENTRANLSHGGLYIRQPGKKYWVTDDDEISRYIASDVGRLSRRDNIELLHQLRVSPKTTTIAEHTNRVQLRNDYHLNNGELVNNTTNRFTPWYLDVDYDANAYDEHVDDLLDRISGTLHPDGTLEANPEMRLVFEEIIGHVLLRNGKDGKMFFLADTTGDGETGKSTFGIMLTHFVDGTAYNGVTSADDKSSDIRPSLVSNLPVSEFKDNTSAAEMTGKMLNYGDETDMGYLKDTSTIKALVTQGPLALRKAYGRSTTDIRSTATFIFSTNGMPDFADKSGGLIRRIFIVPFDHKIAATGIVEDLNFLEHLTTDNAKSYLLNLGLKGVASMKKNKGRVHMPEKVRVANEQFLESNDPVLQYIKDEIENRTKPFIKTNSRTSGGSSTNSFGPELSRVDHRAVYEDFNHWTDENGIGSRAHKTFKAQMQMYGYDLKKSTSDIKLYDDPAGRLGRPKVYVANGEGEALSDLLGDFIEGYEFNNAYWVDVFNDYLDFIEEHGGEEITRSVFNKFILARGYEKKKASIEIDYGNGKHGRPMVYKKKPNENPFM